MTTRGPLSSSSYQNLLALNRAKRLAITGSELPAKELRKTIKNFGPFPSLTINEIKLKINESTTSDWLIKFKSKHRDQYNWIINTVKRGKTPAEKIYNYLHPEVTNHCKQCDKQITFINAKTGYRLYCSSKCAHNDIEFKENIRNIFQEKYGVNSPMQNKESHDKQRLSSYKLKPYTFPSGNIIQLQGFENHIIDYLLSIGINEHDITQSVPSIKYSFDGIERIHFPDLFIKSSSLIIEVKSSYTLALDKLKNIAKFKAARSKMLNYKIFMWCRNTREIIIFDNEDQLLQFTHFES